MISTIISILALVLFTTGQSMSYPVFGTKRYHRASSSSSLIPDSSYYEAVPNYYDRKSILPNYQQGYVTNNGYYYYPRHNYQTYGMPTYHGEYKPTSYYYAPSASYNNYYDDPELATPLDSLHEEIIQENERERQEELYPIGEENWYRNSKQNDKLTNNFLKNLITWNHEADIKQDDKYQQTIQTDQPVEYEDYTDYMIGNNNDYNTQNENLNSYYDKHKYLQLDDKIPIDNSYEEDENEKQLKKLMKNTKNQYPKGQKKVKEFIEDYEIDPDYDDAWINWDRKRHNPSKIISKNDESIKLFTNRKPLNIDYIKSSQLPKLSVMTTKISEKEISNKNNGQKEYVLPRPATPIRNPFENSILNIKSSTESSNSKHQSNDENNKNIVENDTKGNIYDTIRNLIDMEKQYSKTYPEMSKVKKRFVSGEDSLVRELDKLKTRSVLAN